MPSSYTDPSLLNLDALLSTMTPAERARVEARTRELSADPRAFQRAVTTVAPLAGQAYASANALRARRCRDSFFDFVKELWHVVEPATAFMDAPHIRAICDHCQAVGEGRISRLLINIPPGHAKSLLVAVLFPAWMWLRNPGWRVLCGSYALDLAIRDATRSRDLITSEDYRELKKLLGLTWELSGDQNVKSLYSNTAKGFRMALSVSGKATGFRGDCLIFDDLVNAKEPDKITRESLEDARSWWNVTMSSRLNDQRKGAKIGIMQRVSEYDPCADLITRRRADGSFEYDLLAMPSEYDPELYRALGRTDATTSIGWKDWRTVPGEVLFPELFPAEVLTQAKTDLGALAYSAQHGQRPTPAAGGCFNPIWWRFWVHEGIPMPPEVTVDGRDEHGKPRTIVCKQIRIPPVVAHTISADLTFKDSVGADNVALQCWAWGALEGLRQARFLLGEVCKKMDFVTTLHEFENFCESWPLAGTKLVEDKANGPAVISSLKDRITGIIPVEPKGGKEARANAVAPLVESGFVYLPHPSKPGYGGVADFLAELRSFPKGRHDDRVDACTQFLARKRLFVV